MTKGSIQQDDTTFVKSYAPNIESPKYIKQILTALRGEIGSNIVIVGYINIPLTKWIGHPNRRSIRKHKP